MVSSAAILNIVQILHINVSAQFAFFYRIVYMSNENSSISTKQPNHLFNRHPNSLSISPNR